MENINEDVKRFLQKTYSSGYGSGYGYGYGSGSGSGSGYGSGYGYGYGSGAGYGAGSGSGCGSGYGYGSGDVFGDGSGAGSGDVFGDGSGAGSGSGDDDGSGSGSGDGYGIISFCGHNVVVIDGINTVIEKAKGNLGKGFIINGDLTTEKCYVAKIGSLFAHGKTIGEARRDLAKKVFMSMDIDEKIDMFLSEFKIGVKYPAIKFYEWHHILTGSCEMGRDTFVKEHGIDIEKDMFTVNDFINMTKNEYGKEVIKELAERIY